MGAGLGGGSSNAVAALRALNQLAGGIAGDPLLTEIATTLGSDCALFLKNAPVVMRGRGERVEVLPDSGPAGRLRGRRVLLFKPGFGIGTPWAYGRMAARGSDYLPEAEAESRLKRWLDGASPAEELLFNNMEAVAFGKFVALPLLLGKLQSRFGIVGRMSGSGSACFALLGEQQVSAPLESLIRDCWGAAGFCARSTDYAEFRIDRVAMANVNLRDLRTMDPRDKTEIVVQGIAASKGIAYGQVFLYLQSELEVPRYTVDAGKRAAEIARFEQALVTTRQQIAQMQAQVRRT